ncbi:hypothetical protein DLD77_05275 [Chitinophaga alhagiae]|uniref:XRE family transcriptional regulator n=1 Tax=Chitinophaga alhagiae TaxID=2203219 RepID=A0ABM6WAU3_9BACT|nr:hypothetical protein [Chitinophaga alhagiae]AWO01142.1 hypothetical protein DLD77_05275 [Chitinophaga alhagiae]
MTASEFSRCLNYNSCEKVARLFRIEGAKPSVDIVKDIAQNFEELNIRWLLTGDGEMLDPEKMPRQEMEWAIGQPVP